MKVVDHETSKEENQKWGNIARIRAIDPDFNAVIEALEKEANEKIEVKKVEVEGLMRDVNREYKKEVLSKTGCHPQQCGTPTHEAAHFSKAVHECSVYSMAE